MKKQTESEKSLPERNKLKKLRLKISAIEKQEQELDKRARLAEKEYQAQLERLLGASPEHYAASAAQQILEYADKKNLDPKWVYEIIHRVEVDLAFIPYQELRTLPIEAEDYYKLAIREISENYGRGIGSNWQRSKQNLIKAKELAKEKSQGDNQEVTKYQILLDWHHFLYEIEKEYFWDHY